MHLISSLYFNEIQKIRSYNVCTITECLFLEYILLIVQPIRVLYPRESGMNIYDYLDYRQFIKDSIDVIRKNHKLTNRAISERVGVVSPSYYHETIELGAKNMSVEVAERFAALFRLTGAETGYLRLLVQFNQAKTEYEKISLLGLLLPLRTGVHQDSHVLAVNEYAYMAEWQNSVLRELLPLLGGFGNRSQDERAAIMKILRPQITDKQIDDAIGLLESLKFIKRKPNGDYVKTGSILRGDNKTSAAYRALCQLVDIGKRVINVVKPEHRLFKSVVLSMSRETYTVIEMKINDFCYSLLELVSKENGKKNRLYNMNIQFFPLTRLPEEKKL